MPSDGICIAIRITDHPLTPRFLLIRRLCKLCLIAVLFLASAAQAKSRLIVFDMDHTLVDTNQRIAVIMRAIGHSEGNKTLATVTAEQVIDMRLGRPNPLDNLDPETRLRVFGQWSDGSIKRSLFGHKFYGDSTYLVHDGLIEGSPEFVTHLARTFDADVLYLTGRTKENFFEGTQNQLERFRFPQGELILKPAETTEETANWKLEVLREKAKTHTILAVFDDSKRNANKFAGTLTRESTIVRLTQDPNDGRDLSKRVLQIKNYKSDPAAIQKISERAMNSACLSLFAH